MTDKIFSFSATETGYNHIKAEPSKVCEDASGFYDDDQMHICVVADGHGSDNYPRTDRGSQFAVDAAIEQIKAFEAGQRDTGAHSFREAYRTARPRAFKAARASAR